MSKYIISRTSRYYFKNKKERLIDKILLSTLAVISIILIFTFIIKSSSKSEQISSSTSESNNVTQETKLDSGKEYKVYVKERDGKIRTDYSISKNTCLGTRYFAKELENKPDNETDIAKLIGKNLFKSDNYKISAFYGEFYIVDRQKLYKNLPEGNYINSENNPFYGLHEGLDIYSKNNAEFYSLTDGFLINDGVDDKCNTIAVYNDKLDITILYLHAKETFLPNITNRAKYPKIEKGQKLGIQGYSGLSPGSDHVHIEIRKGMEIYASGSKDDKLKSLYPYIYLKTLIE